MPLSSLSPHSRPSTSLPQIRTPPHQKHQYPTRVNATAVHLDDLPTADASNFHLNVRGVVVTDDGTYIAYTAYGPVALTDKVNAIFSGAPNATATEWGEMYSGELLIYVRDYTSFMHAACTRSRSDGRGDDLDPARWCDVPPIHPRTLVDKLVLYSSLPTPSPNTSSEKQAS